MTSEKTNIMTNANNKKLPIDEIIPEILQELQNNNSLILQATPGAGKTTRVPPSLLQITDKNILVLEPRRMAARLSAVRVAQELNEACGETVGYQVRYEKKESKNTRIKFITEGLFLRLLLSDPKLSDIGCVVLDEFHERHIHSDVALMFVSLLQKTTRPDLKLIVMSATLETKSLADYLPQAKTLVCETPNFPVTVEYLNGDILQKPLEIKLHFACEKILKNENKGHILVFLPGRQDILRCDQQLRTLENQYKIKIYLLSADTSIEDQQKIFAHTEHQKIILSTNVAETSLTIEGVTTVVDSGLAKISGHASWSGFPTLSLKPISKSSCTQRSGRAGRTQAGHTIRLFSLHDYNTRPQFEIPEIQRVDLTQNLLELSLLQENQNIFSFPWFDAPQQNTLEASAKLLQYLEAFDDENRPTPIGKAMGQFGFHPRLSRMIQEGKKRNLFPQALLICCLLSEGSLFKRNGAEKEATHSDVAYEIGILKQYCMDKHLPNSILNQVDKIQIKKIETLFRQVASSQNISFSHAFNILSEEELSTLLLSGFPDRVCKFRPQDDKSKKNKLPEYNLCMGGGAVLSSTSSVVEEEFILALEAEEALSKMQSHSTQIQFCHGLSKSLLFTQTTSFHSEKKETYWNSDKRAAFCVNRLYYGKLVVREDAIHGQTELLESLLVEEVKKAWPLPFDNENDLLFFNQRLHLAEQSGLSVGISPIIGDEFEMFIVYLCEGKKSFSQINEKQLGEYIDEYIGYEKILQLNHILPKQIVVGKGRKISVHYEEGKPPYVSSRLQDFFGTTQTPRILNGQLNLVVHLLAPNMQSVQVTTDLAGFWDRGYQEVRKELSRRYPRHSWAEDPKNAEPPELFQKRKSQ